MTCECSVRDPKPDEKKIFVGGLTEGVTSTMLAEYFEQFGPILSAKVVKGEFMGEIKSRGFGFVVFEQEGTAEKVLFYLCCICNSFQNHKTNQRI